jgi:fluoroquinolone resistance protein
MSSNTDASILDQEEFDRATFVGGDFRAADLSDKTFFGCEFQKVSAPEADFRDSVFEDCRLIGCDLTMSLVTSARFLGVEFVDCKLMGVDWSQASGLTFSASFRGCLLSHGSFHGLAMKNARVLDCRAHEANFSGANLSGADFSRTDLYAAKFASTDLTRADLSLAANYEINPSDNVLRETRFSVSAALAVAQRMGIVVPGE